MNKLLDTIGRRNRVLSDKPCEHCGKIFRPVDSKKRTCSRSCGYAIRKLIPPYNKGTSKGWIDKKGYIQIRIEGKTVRQHRHIMEMYLGRKLNRNEDVHHVNGIKTDNRIENLQVILHHDHARITNKRPYKNGYKLNLSKEERFARSERMKKNRLIQKATL